MFLRQRKLANVSCGVFVVKDWYFWMQKLQIFINIAHELYLTFLFLVRIHFKIFIKTLNHYFIMKMKNTLFQNNI